MIENIISEGSSFLFGKIIEHFTIFLKTLFTEMNKCIKFRLILRFCEGLNQCQT